MSSQLSGRQSPEPERQPGAQQQEVPSAGKAASEYKVDPNHAKRASEADKNVFLPSNPVHPVSKAEEKKYEK